MTVDSDLNISFDIRFIPPHAQQKENTIKEHTIDKSNQIQGL